MTGARKHGSDVRSGQRLAFEELIMLEFAGSYRVCTSSVSLLQTSTTRFSD